jgi:hypothetical protein
MAILYELRQAEACGIKGSEKQFERSVAVERLERFEPFNAPTCVKPFCVGVQGSRPRDILPADRGGYKKRGLC